MASFSSSSESCSCRNDCESAWGPDADWQAKFLIIMWLTESHFGAYFPRALGTKLGCRDFRPLATASDNAVQHNVGYVGPLDKWRQKAFNYGCRGAPSSGVRTGLAMP
jgi:hypothetical protein